MDVLRISLTQGNIDNNHFYIPRENHLIPPDTWGGKNKSEAAKPCTFHFLGQSDPVICDIATDKRILRNRKTIRVFFRANDMGANDSIQIERIGDREFRISPVIRKGSKDADIDVCDDQSTSPVRVDSNVLRIVRDTKVSRRVKDLYDFQCQVCGTRLDTATGPYAEGAHIRGLGEPHCGPDTLSNILCLCPNHHALLDMGGFSINDDLSLVGIDGQLSVKPDHPIALDHLQYHRDTYLRVLGARKYV